MRAPGRPAFQLIGDLIGIWGEPSRTGKPTGAEHRPQEVAPGGRGPDWHLFVRLLDEVFMHDPVSIWASPTKQPQEVHG